MEALWDFIVWFAFFKKCFAIFATVSTRTQLAFARMEKEFDELVLEIHERQQWTLPRQSILL
jgi:hypothetical protein